MLVDGILAHDVDARYVCNGSEPNALHDCVIGGARWFLFLNNVQAGDVIKFHAGHFTISGVPTSIIQPSSFYEYSASAQNSRLTQSIAGRGAVGSAGDGHFYGSIPPEYVDGRSKSMAVVYDSQGVPRLFFYNAASWVEIPLIKDTQITVDGTVAHLIQVDAIQSGDSVHIG